MSDIKPDWCCASKAATQKCSGCQESCSCSSGCQCSHTEMNIQASACAGSDAKKCCESVCQCDQRCPCRKDGCPTDGVATNLCGAGTKEDAVSCTMPGNCRCDKGAIGKL